MMRNLDDPNVWQKYNSVLNEVEQMLSYFQKMADALELIEQEAFAVNHSIENVIEGSTETIRTVTAKSFML